MIIFNDYELLYYIKDDNVYARNYMIKKYTPFIKRNINNVLPYSNKKDDLYLECLITLLDCIDFYNDNIKVSFFTYLAISIRRTVGREIKKNYYREYILQDSSLFIDNNDNQYNLYTSDRLFNDKLSQEIYDNCIIGNLSILEYCKINNLIYSQIYKKYKEIIKQLKLIFH